jgi:PPOX class probable FMN-dependent enzyme
MHRFQSLVKSINELTEIIGLPSELVLKKQLSELDGHMQTFIAESPFVLIGTYGQAGSCDVSPRGDAPGLVKILDSKTLVIPDRRGNKRADSLRNIVETGRIGLLFLIPGVGETLRVNGKACLVRDDDVLTSLAIDGKQPVLGIAVEVEEAYLQCAKAILRSKLWEASNAEHKTQLPCLAQMLVDQTKMEGVTVESLNEAIEDSYATKLY